MKICFIGPAGSTHLEKWCKFLKEYGHDITIISLVMNESEYATVIPLRGNYNWRQSEITKVRWLFQRRVIRKTIQEIKPDIVNVHYATSYGIMAALSGIDNYILSVWGADVYDFPQKSFVHKFFLEYSLNHASRIFSTSYAMREETKKYTQKRIDVTPFGVDLLLFNPNKRNRVQDGKFIVGTIKTLSEKYGISYMIKAFAYACLVLPNMNLQLRIGGNGPQENEYKRLVVELGIQERVLFLGFISQEQAAIEWANMDLGIVYSTLDSESFGVSAVEALASGVPLIISDVPGLKESTGGGSNSLVVPRMDQKKLDSELVGLILDEKRRYDMAMNGRKYVEYHYSANLCFRRIEELYYDFIGKR